jgi:hypothetical protein
LVTQAADFVFDGRHVKVTSDTMVRRQLSARPWIGTYVARRLEGNIGKCAGGEGRRCGRVGGSMVDEWAGSCLWPFFPCRNYPLYPLYTSLRGSDLEAMKESLCPCRRSNHSYNLVDIRTET